MSWNASSDSGTARFQASSSARARRASTAALERATAIVCRVSCPFSAAAWAVATASATRAFSTPPSNSGNEKPSRNSAPPKFWKVLSG